MQGKFMLQGWKNMHPEQHYIQDHVDLYEHIDDPAYLAKEETFESWYENPIDLPGRWYLQVIKQLFRENRLAKGKFVRPRPQARPARHHLSGLSPGRRGGRHHDAGTGARRREADRHAEAQDRPEDRARRPYRPVHGRAHPDGALAADRPLDRRPVDVGGPSSSGSSQANFGYSWVPGSSPGTTATNGFKIQTSCACLTRASTTSSFPLPSRSRSGSLARVGGIGGARYTLAKFHVLQGGRPWTWR